MSRIQEMWRGFALKVERDGLPGALKLAVGKVMRKLRGASHGQEIHPFDLEHCTDTSSLVELGALDLPHDRLKHAVRYQTAIVEVFVELLHTLPIRFEEYVFVDIGSGKGRALLLASLLPFRRIQGVEISPKLHEIARNNIAIFRDARQRCHDITIVCADATKYQAPRENTVFYLFNPFDETIMRRTWENISQSLTECPRQIYILYLKPLCRRVFDESPSLEVFKETERYVIYRSRPVA